MTDSRALIDAWVEESSPADLDAAWRSVAARTVAGEVPALDGTSTSLALKLAIVGVVAGAVAVFALSALSVQGDRTPPPESPPISAVAPAAQDSSAGTEAPPADPGASPVVPEEPGPSPMPTQPPEVNEEVDAAPVEPAPRARTKPRRAEPPSLAAELDLLRRARAALRTKNPRLALTLSRRHRREYPDSTFAEERNATEVMALCALGHNDIARSKAAAFRRRYPRSTFNAGLMDACDGADR